MNTVLSQPRVWTLLGAGAGGNAQMRSLAEALQWPFEEKQLVYNPLNYCPNILNRCSLITLNRRRSAPLTPPWPDLVIAASRRSVPVARWIQKQSAGRTRLVHLLHAQAPLDWFDLVITTPQYRLPERPNVLHNLAPLNQIPKERLLRAASTWGPRLEHLPRPFVALLIGGNSSSYELDVTVARSLGQEVSQYVRSQRGSLLATTSPRTSAAATDAFISALDCPNHTYRWRRDDRDNPYLGFLALADELIVTVDSASLLVEACTTGKPVAVFEWPGRSQVGSRKRGQGDEANDSGGARSSRDGHLYERLVYWGLVKPARDFESYHRAVRELGLARPFGQPAAERRVSGFDDMERAVARIRALMGERELDDSRPARERAA